MKTDNSGGKESRRTYGFDETLVAISKVTGIEDVDVAVALYEVKEKTGGKITGETIALALDALEPGIESNKARRVAARIEIQELQGGNTFSGTIKAINEVTHIDSGDIAATLQDIKKDAKTQGILKDAVTQLKAVYADAVTQDLNKPEAQRTYGQKPTMSR